MIRMKRPIFTTSFASILFTVNNNSAAWVHSGLLHLSCSESLATSSKNFLFFSSLWGDLQLIPFTQYCSVRFPTSLAPYSSLSKSSSVPLIDSFLKN